jgi:urea transport system ATP-binding protein
VSAGAPVLELEGLDVRYGTVPAVRSLSLGVGAGELVGLIGPNGAGKSTTLHAIMGLVPAASGDIRLAGRSVRSRAPEAIARAGISLVPEGRRIFGELSVEENLRLGLAARRGNGSDSLAAAYDLFPMLAEFRGRQAGALSGGQQQQLAIGRALTLRPKVLILDEPTEGIQPSIIKDIERAIRKLTSGGEMAILLVEQYYDFAKSLADHYVVMSRGEVVAQGDGADMDANDVRALLAV